MTLNDRMRLHGMILGGVNKKVISEKLGYSERTIRREIGRGSIDGVYIPKRGQEYVERGRRENAKRRVKLLQGNGYREQLKRQLERGYSSPDSIAGRMKIEGKEFVCTKTIYSYIWLYDGGLKGLLTYKKRYKKRYSRQGKRPEGYRHIGTRGEEADMRLEVGHGELDLVISKGKKGGIMTWVDRKSRYGLIVKVKSKSSEEINKKLKEKVRKEGIIKKLKTITNDNGHEFFGLKQLEKKLGFKQYYADPYSSRQRGTNEQFNWQIRKLFPKGTIFSRVATKTIQNMQLKLNRKPRKILGYRTPEEVFNGC